MIATQALDLAFQELALDRRSTFVIALHHEKISETGYRLQAQFVIPAETTAQALDHSLQKWASETHFACLPIRIADLGHHSKGVGMIGPKPILVITERCEHAGELGSVDRC